MAKPVRLLRTYLASYCLEAPQCILWLVYIFYVMKSHLRALPHLYIRIFICSDVLQQWRRVCHDILWRRLYRPVGSYHKHQPVQQPSYFRLPNCLWISSIPVWLIHFGSRGFTSRSAIASAYSPCRQCSDRIRQTRAMRIGYNTSGPRWILRTL
jgi:hypothetical protein